MENIHFTDEAIAGLLTEGALMIIIPVILAIVWKIKTKESLIPILIGAVTWLLFAIILKLAPAYLLMYGDNPAAKTISGSVLLSAATAGVLAGVFEETGRFLAYKFVLKQYTHRRSSISYGIGHGGFESAYVGFQMGMMAVMGIMFNSGMGDMLTANIDEAMKATAFSQLETYTALTMPECLLGVFERIPAIAAHISFSVLVFAAVREKKYFYLYPLAIILHAAVDFSIVSGTACLVPTLVIELLLTAIVAALAFFASRIYKKLE